MALLLLSVGCRYPAADSIPTASPTLSANDRTDVPARTGTPSLTTTPTATAAPTRTTTPNPTTSPTATTTTITPAAPAGLPSPSGGRHWVTTFDEEFNGTGYDHSKLTPCFDWNSGDCTSTFNNGREHYEPGQVRVSGGAGHLVAEPQRPAISDAACYQGACTYRSGLLATARPNTNADSTYLYKFTYGYVEASLKFPATQGFFTAFWMLPADPSYDYATEIDILEVLGHDPTSMFMTYHYADRTRSYTANSDPRKNGSCADKDYSTSYHRFGLDWQPDHIAWYIDGVKCQEFTDARSIGSAPMQIILDLMVDHQWQQNWGKTLLDTSLVRELDVDYLRVYQQR